MVAENKSFFDEQRVVQRTPVIEQKSIYGLSEIRDIWTGDVTSDGTSFICRAAAGGALNAVLDTAERGPYAPGLGLEPGLGGLLPAVPTGGQGVRFGYFNNANGWFYQLDADGFKTGIRRASVDAITQFGSWEGSEIVSDDFGTKIRFNPGDGYIYEIPLSWYGFGPAQYRYQLKKENANTGWMQVVDTKRPEGQTSVVQPHLPVRVEVFTGPGDDPFEFHVTGRQVSVIGKYDPISRPTTIENELISVGSSAWVPIFAVRRRSVEPYALTRLFDLDVISADPVRILIVENAAVPNAAGWEPVTDFGNAQTLLEQNLDPFGATPVDTAGNTILKTVVNGTGRNGGGSPSQPLIPRAFLIEGRPFVVFAQKVGNAAASDITVTGTLKENY